MEKNEAFRHHLQNELLRRAKKNARFSIRAFARQLGVEPSSLAQILGGKRKLTDRMCIRFAEKLSMRPSKFRSLTKAAPGTVAANFSSFKSLSEDAFRIIADWHYYAILELTRVKGFVPQPNWIAKVLGIPASQVVPSIDRLKKLGYLTVDAKGKWIDTLGSAQNGGNAVTGPAFREHQRQLLSKAQEALESIPYDERVQSSMMFIGSRDRVAEAKNRILNFIEELDEFMKSTDQPEEVYTLSVSMFPVTQVQTKQKKESV